MRVLRKQQGWAGLVVLLLVLLVVGLLAKPLLKQYGLYPGTGARVEAGAPASGSQGLRADERVDPGGALPPPQNPMDRVRQLGATVREKAIELDQRVDDASR